MNRDRYPDVYMPMGNAGPPSNEAPWRSNMGLPSNEAPWRSNMGFPANEAPWRSNMGLPVNEAPWRANTGVPMNEAPWSANAMPPMKMENTMGMGMKYEHMHKDCVDHETVLEDVQLAHAYVPFQKFCPTFMPMTALKKGTAFPGLVDVYGWERRHGMGGECL